MKASKDKTKQDSMAKAMRRREPGGERSFLELPPRQPPEFSPILGAGQTASAKRQRSQQGLWSSLGTVEAQHGWDSRHRDSREKGGTLRGLPPL